MSEYLNKLDRNTKYLIVPGNVKSKNDGETHYISASQLIDLYGVDPSECYVYSEVMRGNIFLNHLKRLTPRYDGNYNIEL